MYLFVTEIEAVDPESGKVKSYSGPNIPANSFSEAVKYCQENGLGYCKVIGKFISEITDNVTGNNPLNNWQKNTKFYA